MAVKKKVLFIYGTRPEAIKVAPVVLAARESEYIEPIVLVTGQHREMLDQVNEVFQITPDHDLNILTPRQTLVDITTRTLTGVSDYLQEVEPDAVLVQGDTSTSTFGALAAFYQQIPVIHLEAGLRTGNIYSPFPEEANRKITGQITALHLAPTEQSKTNLLREGLSEDDIIVTGNTVIDALFFAVQQPTKFSNPELQRIADAVSSDDRMLLVTSHRRENLGETMSGIGRAISAIAEKYPRLQIVFPIHRNPAVREPLLPLFAKHGNITVIEPLEYKEFCHALNVVDLVLTDSGGVQEEAPSLGKPVLVMRENTERPEAVDAGTAKLIGTDPQTIIDSVSLLLDSQEEYERMSNAVNPYGDGEAARRTVQAIEHYFGLNTSPDEFSYSGDSTPYDRK